MTNRLTSHLVAAAMLLSGTAYLLWSQELRFELTASAYKHALVRGFFRDHGLGGIHLLYPVSMTGALLLVAFLASCTVAGVLVRRALGSATRGTAEVVVFAVAAAVVPAMLLSLVLWPDGRGTLGSVPLIGGAVAVAAVAAIIWRIRRKHVPVAPATVGDATMPHDPDRGWAIVLLVALVPLLLAVWWNGVVAVRGFDSLADHLPRAARWLRLSRLSIESGTVLTPYYPGNFQLLLRWILVLGTDAYAFVPSLLASLLSLGAVYGISRELGQARWTAIVSASAAASCTLLPYLATTAEADTMTAAFLLLAVLLLLRWKRCTTAPPATDGIALEQLATFAAIGASLGLAIGTKYSALPPALAIGAAALVLAFRRSHGIYPDGTRYLNARTLVLLVATIAAPLVLCCGYWFVRNLIQQGNPVYPVAVGGLPGVVMRYIIPVKPALAASWWARASYPWVEWDFGSVYDDGLGIALPAIALVSFIAVGPRRANAGSERPFVWWITLAAYALWLGTGSITARFGLFPLLLTFVFAGEAWREFGTVSVRIVTLAAVLFGVALTTRSLVVGAVFSASTPPDHRGVPAVVDSLAPTRIFNATETSNRYPLLGRDYRHEVITMFATPTPSDRAASGARYMLLSSGEVRAFTAGTGAVFVARGHVTSLGDTLSLWRLPSP